MPRIRQDALSPLIPGIPSKRPPPPAELDARERKIWRKITERLPADWFTASALLLKEYVRHLVLADDLAKDIVQARAAIDQIKAEPARDPRRKLLLEAMKEYRGLLRAHSLQSQRISTLATRLRLTPQSRYAPSVAATAARPASSYPAPWNDWGETPESDDPDEPDGENRKQ